MNKFNLFFEKKFSIYAILIFSIAITSFVLFPMTTAWFWIIDDHELIKYANSFKNSENFFSAFKDILDNTEVCYLSTATRYRPVYYIFRIIQAYFFKFEPSFYFAMNGILLCGGLFALGMAANRFFSWPMTVAILIATMVPGFHSDMWARLGPAERDAFAYSMVFLCAFAYHDKSRWSWPVSCTTTALAIGVKENFLLLLIPLAYLAWLQIRKKNYISLLWLLFPLISAAPVLYVITRIVFITKIDIYNTNASIEKNIDIFFQFFKSKVFFLYLFIIISYIIVLLFFKNSSNRKKLKKIIILSLFYTTIIFIITCGNIIFYRGTIWGRYGFPYYFLICISIFILIYNLLYIFEEKYKKYINAITVILSLSIIIISCPRVYKLYKDNTFHSEKTSCFHEVIKNCKKYSSIVLIQTRDVISFYEPFFSLKNFHEAGFIPEVFYVSFKKSVSNPFYDSLEKGLQSSISNQNLIEFDSSQCLISMDFYNIPFIFDHEKTYHNINHMLIDNIPNAVKNGNYMLTQNTKFFIPTYKNRKQPTMIVFSGEFDRNLNLSFSINGEQIEKGSIISDENHIKINIPTENMRSIIHPSFLEIELLLPKNSRDTKIKIAAIEFLP